MTICIVEVLFNYYFYLFQTLFIFLANLHTTIQAHNPQTPRKKKEIHK